MQKKRQNRLIKACEEDEDTCTIEDQTGLYASIASLKKLIPNKGNAQQVRENILDVLVSYYKVSGKRFVDAICQQVIGHFLLEEEESPLRVFSSELVMSLKDDQLEMVAGEDAGTKERRSMLESEIRNLQAAMKVLNS